MSPHELTYLEAVSELETLLDNPPFGDGWKRRKEELEVLILSHPDHPSSKPSTTNPSENPMPATVKTTEQKLQTLRTRLERLVAEKKSGPASTCAKKAARCTRANLHRRRPAWLSLGICVLCGVRTAMKPDTRCAVCAEVQDEYKAGRRASAHALGADALGSDPGSH